MLNHRQSPTSLGCFQGSLQSVGNMSLLAHLLCMEFEGPWCMGGAPSFLFMPVGGHMPDPIWGGIPPMLEPIPGPKGRAPIWCPGPILLGGMVPYCPPLP